MGRPCGAHGRDGDHCVTVPVAGSANVHAGELACTRMGAQPGIATMTTVDRFLQRAVELAATVQAARAEPCGFH